VLCSTAVANYADYVNLFAAMAGNIIPAIATTNAVIAGLIVMEALKILGDNFNKCSTVSLAIGIWTLALVVPASI